MVGKGYKVWNCSRSVKKSLMAANLKELEVKGKEKLEVEGPVTIVLEDDGTIVADNEYFKLLEAQTTFIFVAKGEKWKPAWETVSKGEDTVDNDAETPKLHQLAAKLRDNFSKLVTFTNDDLQIIVDTDVEELKSLIGCTTEDVTSIQDTCQRKLDEDLELGEALQFYRLIKATKNPSTDGKGEGGATSLDDGVGGKRRKLDA